MLEGRGGVLSLLLLFFLFFLSLSLSYVSRSRCKML